MPHRKSQFTELFPQEPTYRYAQIKDGLFSVFTHCWEDITTLPKELREKLTSIPFFSHTLYKFFESKNKDTYKAILKSPDDLYYETVLMQNAKDQWTICVSSQIGCAMQCDFCATGTMGLKRSLDSDEIVDQYRFWQQFLKKQNFISNRISNIVFMGMGEPLANYEQVKDAINEILEHTNLGSTNVTVSTVGLLSQLQYLLTDPNWPNTRIAISLHSPDPKKRKEIVKTTIPGFHDKLITWTHDYMNKLGNRQHYLTFEYTLINQVNDSVQDAHALGKFVSKTAVKKVNLIPLNPVKKKTYIASDTKRIDQFQHVLESYNITTTVRKTMGQDINAACGQLVVEATNE